MPSRPPGATISTCPTWQRRLLADTLDVGDLVITVCDRANEELGGAAKAHWSIPNSLPDGSRGALEAAHAALATGRDLAARVSGGGEAARP